MVVSRIMETALSSGKVTALREGDLAQYRTPPHNNEAEQALLGAVLVNNAAYHRVAEFLLPDYFADAVHGRIFQAAGKLIERGQVANPVTLKNLFDQDGALAEIGGAKYLANLAASVVTIINAEDYGRTIHDLHLRRQLITIGEDVVNDAYRHDLDHPGPDQQFWRAGAKGHGRHHRSAARRIVRRRNCLTSAGDRAGSRTRTPPRPAQAGHRPCARNCHFPGARDSCQS